MAIERKAYICEHCNIHRPTRKKVYLTKSKAEKHERICYYNTDRKTCWTCMYNNYLFDSVNHCTLNKGKPYSEQMEIAPSERCIVNCEYWNYVSEHDESEGDA
jgi:predicted AAA+ superfamily ATPase